LSALIFRLVFTATAHRSELSWSI